MIKTAVFKLKGMKRDLDVSVQPPEFAYENKNIRFCTTEKGSTLAITNEKGTEKLYTYYESKADNNELILSGKTLGYCKLNKGIVLFNLIEGNSYGSANRAVIYHISSIIPKDFYTEHDNHYRVYICNCHTIWGDSSSGPYLYSTNDFIDTLYYSEKNREKVYFAQKGYPLRMLTVLNNPSDEAYGRIYNNIYDFDFIPSVDTTGFKILPEWSSGIGLFPSGVIQYAASYIKNDGRESKLIGVSPLYYITHNDRGGTAEDIIQGTFNITLKGLDPQYAYVRIFSIHRSSKDAVPSCKLVAELPIQSSKNSKEVSQIIYDDNDVITLQDKEGQIKYLNEFDASYFDEGIFYVSEYDYDYIYVNNYLSDKAQTIIPINRGEISIDTNAKKIACRSMNIEVINCDLIIQDNNTGEALDPYTLLYIGGDTLYADTLTQKDDTLFIGNVEIANSEYKTKEQLGLDALLDRIEYKYYYLYDKLSIKSYYDYNPHLNLSSQQLKVFKYLETYRLGVQLQNKKGEWTQPIWLKDLQNTLPPSSDKAFYNQTFYKTGKPTLGLGYEDLEHLLSLGYQKIRPIIVYPQDHERECICQGVLCPTIYNVKDRYENGPYAQASWFFRPTPPYDIETTDSNSIYGDNEILTSPKAIVGTGELNGTESTSLPPLFMPKAKYYEYILQNKGDVLEYRHNKPIPDNKYKNAEIQNIRNPLSDPIISSSQNINNYINERQSDFYIDQNIITLNSPEIELNEITNLSNCKLRIVGVIPITSFYSDLNIETETPPLNLVKVKATPSNDVAVEINKKAAGFIKNISKTDFVPFNIDRHYGYRSTITSVSWFDDVWRSSYSQYEYDMWAKPNNINFISGALLGQVVFDPDTNTKYQDGQTGYVIYPWHRNGSLNNQRFPEDNYLSAKLKHKILSNFRYSYDTCYFKYLNGSGIIPLDKSDIQLFNNKELGLIKLKSGDETNLKYYHYYGNIDKVSFSSTPYPIRIANRGLTSHNVFNNTYKYGALITTGILDRHASSEYQKYNISSDEVFSFIANDNKDYGTLSNGNLASELNSHVNNLYQYSLDKEKYGLGEDPISIKYKSTPHAVIVLQNDLNPNGTYVQRILPTFNYYSDTGKSYVDKPFWDANLAGYTRSLIYLNSNLFATDVFGPGNDNHLEFGWLWLGELYREVQNKFGGITEEAIEKNQWYVCGNEVDLLYDIELYQYQDLLKYVVWQEGDTYYQRYDCLKTYPFTSEDQNSIVESLSFMCETKINLDARSDKNRGTLSHLHINPDNINTINSIYNQANNFYSHRVDTKDPITGQRDHKKYPYSIIWSLPKELDSKIDIWTSITSGASINTITQGGPIIKLLNYNNNVIEIQESSIGHVLYNTITQISTSEGVPVELSNSGKVSGIQYISTQTGSSKAYSICSSLKGLYFIDHINKQMFALRGTELISLSKSLHMNSLFNTESLDNMYLHWDQRNDDILITSSNISLSYSENLDVFTSFYDYMNIPVLTTVDGHPFIIKNTNNSSIPALYQYGDYNMIFGEYKPFYVTVIANPEPLVDKTFTNIEFRSEDFSKYSVYSWKSTFDTLTVWNEYQKGVSTLSFTEKPSNLQKKFKIWRANIPRDINSRYGRDRIRNPWIYLKLEKNKENTSKTILHDLIVKYI